MLRRERRVREARLDRQSQPFRDLVQRWAQERSLGFAGGWYAVPGYWRYELWNARLTVSIAEDGSFAHVTDATGTEIVAKTVRGLRIALTRLYA